MYFYNSVFLPTSRRKHRNIKYHKVNLLRAKINKILKRCAFKKLYQYSLEIKNFQLEKIKKRRKIANIIKKRFYDYGLEVPYTIEQWLND